MKLYHEEVIKIERKVKEYIIINNKKYWRNQKFNNKLKYKAISKEISKNLKWI